MNFPPLLLWALALPAPHAGGSGPAAAHPLSISRLEIAVDGAGLSLELLLQTRTLIEIPGLGLDRDGDLALSNAELSAGWLELRRYLQDGLLLEVDGGPWHPEFAELAFAGAADLAVEGLEDFTWVKGTARLATDSRPLRLRVASELFYQDGNPSHIMHVTVRGLHGRELLAILKSSQRSADFSGSAHPFREYALLGVQHVLEGLDHLAFLLALLLGVAGVRSLLAAVTAFTLAHSLTLALSALEVYALSPAVVEPGIALSIVVVLWLHLALGPGRARPWIPAFCFGLLHGFGFAGVLGEIGLPPGARSAALLGFNAGVELGQLAFVLPVVLAAGLLQRAAGAARLPALRLHAGMILGAAGLHFFAATVVELWLPAAAPWSLMAVTALLGGAVAAVLLRRTAPDGTPLLGAAGSATLLAVLFQAGAWLGNLGG